MKLIVGLGNPGKTYEHHRHNIGFQMADAFGMKFGIDIKRRQFSAFVGEGVVRGEKIMLMKPQTFMNLSGDAVREMSEFYHLSLEDLLVLHDEIDVECGRMKWVKGRGSGGHNGVRSLGEMLGSLEFCRLRIGVGRPPTGVDPADYVLAPFTKTEASVVKEMIEQGVVAIEEFLHYGLAYVQQKCH